jgi:hypothetical protein
MQILKEIGVDWRERRLIKKLYMDQSVKVGLDQGDRRSTKNVRGVVQRCLSPILFSLLSECLATEALEGFGGYKERRQVIRTAEYANDVVLLAKEETVLQGMIDRLIQI